MAGEDLEHWWHRGFAAVEHPIVDTQGLDGLAAVLHPLLAQWESLPPGHAQELASGAPGIREIVMPSRLAPALLRSAAYDAMRTVAVTLLGGGAVRHHFDHVVEKPSGAPATAWHQDVAFDLRSDVPMATVWFPLVDVDASNGAMQFVPGSQAGPIAVHVPHGRHGRRAVEVDVAHAITCAVPAGGCTVHMARTLHGSTPNTSAATRVAWVVKFVPDGRPALRRTLATWRERRRPFEARTDR